eukprot:tig00001027_g6382.t1
MHVFQSQTSEAFCPVSTITILGQDTINHLQPQLDASRAAVDAKGYCAVKLCGDIVELTDKEYDDYEGLKYTIGDRVVGITNTVFMPYPEKTAEEVGLEVVDIFTPLEDFLQTGKRRIIAAVAGRVIAKSETSWDSPTKGGAKRTSFQVVDTSGRMATLNLYGKEALDFNIKTDFYLDWVRIEQDNGSITITTGPCTTYNVGSDVTPAAVEAIEAGLEIYKTTSLAATPPAAAAPQAPAAAPQTPAASAAPQASSSKRASGASASSSEAKKSRK